VREVTGDLNTTIARCKTERWQPEQYSFEQVLAAGSVTFLEETMQGCGCFTPYRLPFPRTYNHDMSTQLLCLAPVPTSGWWWCLVGGRSVGSK